MKNILVLNKKEGETPLETLQKFRHKNKVYKDLKMTYAGRLDPMASGLLLVLAGQEVKNKEKYLRLSKEYEFEILFGFSTDTHDILGKVISTSDMQMEEKWMVKEIKKNLKSFLGNFSQKYPLYSSKTVKGRQLFEYGREGIYVDLPERMVSVADLKFLKLKKINTASLLKNIERRVTKVKGDFRQNEILKVWHKNLLPAQAGSSKNPRNVFIGKFKIKCGSGTYVRGIADALGQKIGIPALALSIKRTKIGKWSKGG